MIFHLLLFTKWAALGGLDVAGASEAEGSDPLRLAPEGELSSLAADEGEELPCCTDGELSSFGADEGEEPFCCADGAEFTCCALEDA